MVHHDSRDSDHLDSYLNRWNLEIRIDDLDLCLHKNNMPALMERKEAEARAKHLPPPPFGYVWRECGRTPVGSPVGYRGFYYELQYEPRPDPEAKPRFVASMKRRWAAFAGRSR